MHTEDKDCMLLTPDAFLWIPYPKILWRPMHIISFTKDGSSVNIKWLDNNSEEVMDLKSLKSKIGGIFECSYKSIPQIDLSCMDIINEPEVLHTLKTRFCNQEDIYTYCDSIKTNLSSYRANLEQEKPFQLVMC